MTIEEFGTWFMYSLLHVFCSFMTGRSEVRRDQLNRLYDGPHTIIVVLCPTAVLKPLLQAMTSALDNSPYNLHVFWNHGTAL